MAYLRSKPATSRVEVEIVPNLGDVSTRFSHKVLIAIDRYSMVQRTMTAYMAYSGMQAIHAQPSSMN